MKYSEKKFIELMNGKCYGAEEENGEYYSADMWIDHVKKFHPQYETMKVVGTDAVPYVVLK